MDRQSAETILLAALAVVALAVAAATLPSAAPSGSGGDGGFAGGSGGDGAALPTPAETPTWTLDLSFLRPLIVALFVIALVGLLVYVFLQGVSDSDTAVFFDNQDVIEAVNYLWFLAFATIGLRL